MQGVADTISESNNEIGGQHRTRLSLAVTKGDTIWAVESAIDWPTSGQVVVFGTRYDYALRSDTTLEGITYEDGDTTVVGAAVDITVETIVTDVSLDRSAMDALRGAMLVTRAEGKDLNVVGRNIGVNRIPSIPSDDLFREIIKAVAYNPRGTIYGMELFLDAALGSGNYEIIEDLIEDPNTVKVRLLADASTLLESEGKAFIEGNEFKLPSSSTTVSITEAVVTDGVVHSVLLKDENHTSDFRSAKPSVERLVEFVGDTGTQLWTYEGDNEAIDVTVLSNDQGTEIDDSAVADVARYRHPLRIQPESYASVNIVTYLDSTGTWFTGSTAAEQWGVSIFDGFRDIGWGTWKRSTGIFRLSFRNGSTSFGDRVELPFDTYYAIEMRKYGQERVELWIDGSLRLSTAYSNFTTASALTSLTIGSSSVAARPTGRIKQCGYFVHTDTDYWGGRGAAGAVLATGPQDLDVGGGDAIFVGGDVGKRVFVRGGAVGTSPGTGSNNGTFEISVVNSAQNVTLVGEDQLAGFVETGNPNQFNAADRVFQYPDDIGKSVVISGATAPSNNGARTIIRLLDPDDDTDYSAPGVAPDLDAFDTRHPTKTDKAIVSGGSPYITEAGLNWVLNPIFADETPLDWEVADVGSVSGTTITLAQALPITSPLPVVSVTFSKVLSAQLLENILTANTLVSAGPPREYTHYPFYLADPLGFVRTYLELLTAAGVIPLLLEE
jgi:hypothetical protein